MWDGSVNEEMRTLLENALASGATVAACGHGGVALLDVKDRQTGDFYIKNKQVSHDLLVYVVRQIDDWLLRCGAASRKTGSLLAIQAHQCQLVPEVC